MYIQVYDYAYRCVVRGEEVVELKKDQYKATIDLSSIDHRVIRYLKGETIEVDDLPLKRQKGWQLVCVDGFPLGWGKLVNGSLRNKYLPGWRWQS